MDISRTISTQVHTRKENCLHVFDTSSAGKDQRRTIHLVRIILSYYIMEKWGERLIRRVKSHPTSFLKLSQLINGKDIELVIVKF
jgi:hypothetical protein